MTRRWSLRRRLLFVAIAIFFHAGSAAASCDAILPAASEAASTARRAIVAGDLLGLRDIGYPDGSVTDAATPFGVSPDGREVAFVISRADVDRNDYCRALIVLSVAGGAPRVVDRGGEFIQYRGVVRGLFASYGTPKIATPVWSPDCRRIAYLKRVAGRTQIWLVDLATGSARSITDTPTDVEDFAWASDGAALIYSTRPREIEVQGAVDREGLSGWLYDDRMVPNAGTKPRLRESDIPAGFFTLDLKTGSARSASAAERSALVADLGRGATADLGKRGAGRIVASSELLAPAHIVIERENSSSACRDPACQGSFGGIWAADRHSVVFLRREGWLHERTALYRWTPGRRTVTRLLTTADVLTGCVADNGALICGRENSITPRRVVRIDLASGSSTTLFDPNPGFARIDLSKVTRLRWRNNRGLEAWGDLVLPPGYRPGTRLPMVIVQYHSRGFLRGGTDDEYPIYLFAARGFAVLSLERPSGVASLLAGVTTPAEANTANFKDWADRRSIQSSIEEGIRHAVATGAVDPARIGITGLSDGATSVRFALINSNLFAAAAISSCCVEPVTSMTINGPRFADENRTRGYPRVGDADPGFWQPMSLAMNAARIETPLLMQLSDDEYLLALEAFEALREHGKPVEMYVYPDEHHGKWQPAHRRAVYDRNLDWFDFWLRSAVDPDPAKRDQYRRWQTMRDRKRATWPGGARPDYFQARAHVSTSTSCMMRRC